MERLVSPTSFFEEDKGECSSKTIHGSSQIK